MSGEDEGVLTRWSRLKRQDSAEPEPGETSPDTNASESAVSGEAAPSGDPASGEGEERMLTEAELPDIESLTYESDFSVFMKANVPLALQKRALRKLWVSNPVLANLDGLNDHDLDYTIAEMKDIAAQSAADLASNAKRLNVTDLRAKEREMRRMAAAQKPNQEGAFEAMGTGQVDINWAREHHNLWAAEVEAQEEGAAGKATERPVATAPAE